MDYEKDLNYIRDPKTENAKLPQGEIWHKDKGIIKYDTVAAMLADAEKFKKAGMLRASYVYDHTTGLKIFAKVGVFVKGKDGTVTAFMRKPDAEKFMEAKGGTMIHVVASLEGKPLKVALNK